MHLEEKIFLFTSWPHYISNVEAAGIQIFPASDLYVGLYFNWMGIYDDGILPRVLSEFDEAKLFRFEKNYPKGLACKMNIKGPFCRILGPSEANYEHATKLFKGIKALNPKPFLAVDFDYEQNEYTCKLIRNLRNLDSRYGYFPN